MLEKMFNYENPVWQFMNRVADLLILNLIFIISCIPIVTIGASYTALTYVTVKIVRKEDTYIWKEYWKSFKTNFKQATIMWLILLVFIVMLSLDIFMWSYDPTALPKALKVTTVIVVLIVATLTIYAFPILSHFDNTIRNTFVNSFIVSLVNIPYTIFFLIVLLAPVILVLIQPALIMGFAMFGFSGPALLNSVGWSKLFKKLEPPKEEPEVVDRFEQFEETEESGESEGSDEASVSESEETIE